MANPVLDTHKLIVGTSGAGKTTTARAELEQLLDQRRHLVVIDPMDVYWGERSDAAGAGPGYDIPIFGGRHGDVALTAADGAAIARIIVEQQISAIVSIKHLQDDYAQRAFVLAFLRELRLKPQGNFHLIVDEAEEFCPQTPPDDVAFELTRLISWFTKRGRSEGFVLTLITQRPADISKAVVSLCETIVAHRLVAPLDQDAIDRYLKRFAEKTVRDQVMKSLAGLKTGERWIYSPAANLLERGVTPPIATFDSSRTPAPGETLVEPKLLSQVDMTAIAAMLARPSAMPADPITACEAGTEAALALLDRDRRIEQLETDVAQFKAIAEQALTIARRQNDDAVAMIQLLDKSSHYAKFHPLDAASAAGDAAPAISQAAAPRPATAQRREAVEDAPSAVSSSAATRGRKALLVLAGTHPSGLTEKQWAQLAGYSSRGGTWGTYKAALRKAGLVEQRGDLWFATAHGVESAGGEAAPMPAPGPELARAWFVRIPGVRRMGEALIERFPDFVSRDALAAELGMSAGGGTFNTYLGRLRGNGLLQEDGKRLRLSPTLMESIR